MKFKVEVKMINVLKTKKKSELVTIDSSNDFKSYETALRYIDSLKSNRTVVYLSLNGEVIVDERDLYKK